MKVLGMKEKRWTSWHKKKK